MFVLSGFAVVAALAVLAIRVNRSDGHPAISAALWLVALTLLAWTCLVWIAGA
jgi:hypothetical protein